MQVEHLKRFELSTFNLGKREPPQDALEALREIDNRLELFFDEDSGRWLIYRLKSPGVTPSEDYFVYQLTCPGTGTGLTPGIKNWALQFDKTNGGYKDEDDLKRDFMFEFKAAKERLKTHHTKLEEDMDYYTASLWDYYQRSPVSVSVPVTVGFNKKTMKPIRMAEVKPHGFGPGVSS